jgi:hypothetical protein
MRNTSIRILNKTRRNFVASDIGFDDHQREKESDKEKKVD